MLLYNNVSERNCTAVRCILGLIIVVFSFSAVFGIYVAEDEIKKSRRVVFENYKGGVRDVSVRELIEAGHNLASISEGR